MVEEHDFRDDELCACGHPGEFHYCEMERPNGTIDDDWCDACADEGGVTDHVFTRAKKPAQDAPHTPRDNPFRVAARLVIEMHRELLEKLAKS